VDRQPDEEVLRMARWLAHAVAGTYWLVLCVIYGVWLSTWHTIGYRPQYGHPKSWTVGFLADHRGFLAGTELPLLLLFYAAPLLAPGIFVSLLVAAARKRLRTKEERLTALAFVSVLVAVGFLLLDPFGALNWYAD
jgi:hypothetical protein